MTTDQHASDRENVERDNILPGKFAVASLAR